MAAAALAGNPQRAPLGNRVDPLGRLFPGPARGTLMGNRGGRFHDAATLSIAGRPWATRHWICCRLTFAGRQRKVWSSGYTEVFFLDEVTALSAGHRPCFECRRQAALAFVAAWGRGNRSGRIPTADLVDRVLHEERINPTLPRHANKRMHVAFIDTLPDRAVIFGDGLGADESAHATFAVRGHSMLPWSPQGWGPPLARPHTRLVSLVTPPSIVSALVAGYRPQWHPSAGLNG